VLHLPNLDHEIELKAQKKERILKELATVGRTRLESYRNERAALGKRLAAAKGAVKMSSAVQELERLQEEQKSASEAAAAHAKLVAEQERAVADFDPDALKKGLEEELRRTTGKDVRIG